MLFKVQNIGIRILASAHYGIIWKGSVSICNLHDLRSLSIIMSFVRKQSDSGRLRMLLPQRIVERINFLSFHKGWSGVTYAKVDT